LLGTQEIRMKLTLAAGLAACLFVATAASALTFGQIDTFEDGTTGDWVVAAGGVGHPAPPQNIPDGGPAGAEDNFLLLTAVGGGGSGSHLSVLNMVQWAGDYLGTGVNQISMSLANLGNSDLDIRLLFADPVAGPPTNLAITDAVVLPAGSGWQTAVFAVSPADLIVLQGDATALLGATTQLRIFHSIEPMFPGEAIVAQLGVDNVLALAGEVATDATTWSAVKALYR
jgi:hypothetical protein